MKRIALALLATAASTAALGADLPSRRAPPAYEPPVVAPPTFTWTGFYLGGNAGYTFGNGRSYSLYDPTGALNGNIGTLRPPFVGTRSNGFTGGAQIGYNYQFGNSPTGGVVLGIEADAQYTRTRKAFTVTTGDNLGNEYDSLFAYSTDFVGTVRGRLGYSFDRILVYGTGGLAYGGVRDGVAFLTNGNPLYAGSRDRIRFGYAYGGGVEYALPVGSFANFLGSSAVTVKAEYLHYDLGADSIAVPSLSGLGGSYFERIRTYGNLVRAGVNFKFGSAAPAPVVARY